MSVESVIPVPNALTETIAIERFYGSVEQAPPADQYAFDMSGVTFVKPYGVIALLSAARQLTVLSAHPVRVKNLTGNIHAYLDVEVGWLVERFEVKGYE